MKASIVCLEERITVLLLPTDPLDERNIMLEVRAGTGGDEAGIWCGDLQRMYMRFAESEGWKVRASPVPRRQRSVSHISGSIHHSTFRSRGGVRVGPRRATPRSEGRITGIRRLAAPARGHRDRSHTHKDDPRARSLSLFRSSHHRRAVRDGRLLPKKS